MSQLTPIHNAMQLRFLNQQICTAVARWHYQLATCLTEPRFFRDRWASREAKWKASKLLVCADALFEQSGWDVVIRTLGEGTFIFGRAIWNDGIRYDVDTDYTFSVRHDSYIELKPRMGDDWPVVLRQVTRRREHECSLVIFDEWFGSSDLIEVIEVFRRSRINLVSYAEISG